MDGHPSRPPVPRRLERRTRSLGGPRQRDLLRLAPNGVWRATVSPRCWWALTPPFHPYRRRGAGGLLSVPLSVGFRRLGFPQRPALRCPDFPRTPESARGHPACTSDCRASRRPVTRRSPPPPRGSTTSGISRPSARSERHSGHARTPRSRITNSPQHGHSRLAPRESARSSWSSVRAMGVTGSLIAGCGTPPRPCRGRSRGRRRSARARSSPAGGGCARRPRGRRS